MHELSLVMQIVEVVEEQAKLNSVEKIKFVELEVGKQSGVVVEALEFAFDEAKKGSLLQNAELRIQDKEAIICCDKCKNEYAINELYTPCPNCGSVYGDLIQGDELKIIRIGF